VRDDHYATQPSPQKVPNYFNYIIIIIIFALSVIFTKLPKVNSRPTGENSPDLVTLSGALLEGELNNAFFICLPQKKVMTSLETLSSFSM
jgi:hypothetical protein